MDFECCTQGDGARGSVEVEPPHTSKERFPVHKVVPLVESLIPLRLVTTLGSVYTLILRLLNLRGEDYSILPSSKNFLFYT